MKFTAEDKDFIENIERDVKSSLEVINYVKQFKLEDYLVAFHYSGDWDNLNKNAIIPVTNSYGSKRKYQVVFVTESGIPFIKELNKVGKPAGEIECLITECSGGWEKTYHFELDPDYADAIILDDESAYTPSAEYSTKVDLRKEIVAYNKARKINTQHYDKLEKFFQNVNIGDVFWRSTKTYFTIHKISTFTLSKVNKNGIGTHIKLDVTLNNGKVSCFTARDLIDKSLYTSQPRSYSELKDPK